MKRSEFLTTSASALTMAALPRAGAPTDLVDISLIARPFPYALPNGLTVPLLAYNGSIPGPVIRITRGQRIRVRYLNQTEIPTSVHWHGQTLPNRMDGVAGITQPPVMKGGTFTYEFEPAPSGTRWYHDHAFHLGAPRGLFGFFIIDEPTDEPADVEYALVFHDIPNWTTLQAAMRGVSNAMAIDPPGSPERAEMRASTESAMQSMHKTNPMNGMEMQPMGDMLSYRAHLVNGGIYPHTKALPVRVGQLVRLRILNASSADTQYIRLAGHSLIVTHCDGNRLAQPVSVECLRVGVAERYDAYVRITKPGAWLLQGISSDPLIREQAIALHTDEKYLSAPQSSPQTLDGVDYFTYQKAAGTTVAIDERGVTKRVTLTITGGKYGEAQWMIDGAVWPHTPKIDVRRGDRVLIKFVNKSDMEHPMHLHGHVVRLVEVGGIALLRPLAKDVSLVPANGGTTTWIVDADSPPGRWLLHCHNAVHMMAGLMTELDYSQR